MKFYKNINVKSGIYANADIMVKFESNASLLNVKKNIDIAQRLHVQARIKINYYQTND